MSKNTTETMGENDDRIQEQDSQKEALVDENSVSTEPQVSDSELEQAAKEADQVNDSPKKTDAIKSRRSHPKKKLILIISALVAVVLIALFVIPLTRYAILGTFIKKNVTVSIIDSKTNKPVSGVLIRMASKDSVTDAQGIAIIKSVPVGEKTVTAQKKYYRSLTLHVVVPLFTGKKPYQFHIIATGRQVPIKILDKVSQQAIDKATISFDGATSTTDIKGQTILVLPADKTSIDATVTAPGYNRQSATIHVTEQQDPGNTIALIPAGKVYFLSNRTGVVNVMKSNLDGLDAQVVLAGTGNETYNTTLLSSRDWKYLAFRSQRDGGNNPKLFLIDTTQGDKLTTIDSGNATFNPIGWYNNYFLYTVIRHDVQNWQPKQYAIKSFNAQTGQLITLDENNAVGSQSSYAQEVYEYSYILDNTLIFTKTWSGDYSLTATRQPNIYSIQPDGQQKRPLAILTPNTAVQATLAAPQEVYFQTTLLAPNNPAPSYEEYADGQFKSANDITATDFGKPYPTYLISPSGKNTFWSETRDGKNTLFVGDANGTNAKQIASLSDFAPYGWITDNYLLVSKNGSELYIISPSNPNNPVKVTDYYKSAANFPGYGYGYGGI